jgi:hypothetical protein
VTTVPTGLPVDPTAVVGLPVDPTAVVVNMQGLLSG